MYDLLLILPIILSWSIRPFLGKSLTQYISNKDIILLYHFIYHLFILAFCGYILLFRKNNATIFFKKIKGIPKYMYIILCLAILLSIISQLCYFKLIKTVNVNIFVNTLRGGSALLIFLIGMYAYKEKINLTKIIGIILVLLGIYVETFRNDLNLGYFDLEYFVFIIYPSYSSFSFFLSNLAILSSSNLITFVCFSSS